jgi:hypothetical protein
LRDQIIQSVPSTRWLKPREAAAYAGVAVITLRRAVKAGKAPMKPFQQIRLMFRRQSSLARRIIS